MNKIIDIREMKREALELAWLTYVELAEWDEWYGWNWHKAAKDVWFRRRASMSSLDKPDPEFSANDYAIALIEWLLLGLSRGTLKEWGLWDEKEGLVLMMEKQLEEECANGQMAKTTKPTGDFVWVRRGDIYDFLYCAVCYGILRDNSYSLVIADLVEDYLEFLSPGKLRILYNRVHMLLPHVPERYRDRWRQLAETMEKQLEGGQNEEK